MYTKEERRTALDTLRTIVEPGETIYTILRHTARSGMSRDLSVLVMEEDADEGPWLHDITVLVARALGYPQPRHGLRVAGCGFDAGHEVKYNLGEALFCKGFTCIGERCPSNDHFNGDRNYQPHTHRSGGYALRHEWI